MKTLCAMLALLSVGAVSGAQEQTPNLKIGPVTVRLGMTKSELQAKLSDTQALKVNEDFWLIGYSRENPNGDVFFTNGIVTGASRSWLIGNSDGVEALIGAMGSFTQEGLRMCVISHETSPSPDSSLEKAAIRCGAKWLVVYKAKIGATEQSPNQVSEGIDEGIGYTSN